jgi:hypothetical protein
MRQTDRQTIKYYKYENANLNLKVKGKLKFD